MVKRAGHNVRHKAYCGDMPLSDTANFLISVFKRAGFVVMETNRNYVEMWETGAAGPPCEAVRIRPQGKVEILHGK